MESLTDSCSVACCCCCSFQKALFIQSLARFSILPFLLFSHRSQTKKTHSNSSYGRLVGICTAKRFVCLLMMRLLSFFSSTSRNGVISLCCSPFPESIDVSAVRIYSEASTEDSTTIVLSEKWTIPSSNVSTLDCFVPSSALHSMPSVELCFSSFQSSIWIRLSPSFLTLSTHRPDLIYWKISQVQIQSSKVVSCLSCPLQEKVMAGQIAVMEFPISARHSAELERIDVTVDNKELQNVMKVDRFADSLKVSLDLCDSYWLSCDNRTFQLEFTLEYANQEHFHSVCPLTISSPFSVTTKLSSFPDFALSESTSSFQPEQNITAVLHSLDLPSPSCPFPSPSCFHSKAPRSSLQQVIAGFWFDLDVRIHNSVPISIHSIRIQHPKNAYSRCLLINPIASTPLRLSSESSTVWHFSLAVSSEWINQEIEGGIVEIGYSL